MLTHLFLGMFYYMLGNLRPELRSSHQSIQLIACVTSQNLQKYGFAAVLAPFVRDVNMLASVRKAIHFACIKPLVFLYCIQQNGVDIDVNGKVCHLRGTVLVMLADTLAAHQLGGFKIGVGFSLRKCRHCMATFDDMQTKVLYTCS